MKNSLFSYKKKDSPIKVIDFCFLKCLNLDDNLIEINSGEKNMIMTWLVYTPQYITPEVIQLKYGQKNDIWSYWVILY